MAMELTENRNTRAEARICRFVRNPSEACYCAELNSYNIPLILRFCESNFECCEVYKRLTGKLHRQGASPDSSLVMGH